MAKENERWRVLAAQAATEKDPKKLIELVEQLNQALKADGKMPEDFPKQRIA
jgi:hypothetical protein